ncbi:LysR family transcriptional regulator [Achromobacter xylosoxidans]|jgi:LysR family transcriptional activator of nhaA|uniref:Transcriptional activator protein NhaR n=1 Tax=Achromobacter mucicolens TaxID=1389922 RepID=A0ABM8LH84_9BURK|nr:MULTISPECIES: transcriptional activator NhaR [Achromobacter]KXJ65481.1 LysR family transcriptional regulator [Achromobacter xylosoxidans]UDG76035.1 transcriptional activator NhaR [Achromobacter sp. 77]WGJ90954.1 transcriptional activator NhaR [Achromobacter mucicolens]CAB3892844.1 Transcriptional activator protein NhaR [Achromobacter mucicolens]
MVTLNYKHLRYFWTVAKAGSIARAAQQLQRTPQSISGQIQDLESALGTELFRRAGRGLELTDVGRHALLYADRIFTLGDELLDDLRERPARRALEFKVGVAEGMPKAMVYRMIEPALQLAEDVRLICREGRLPFLLADLAVHRFDMVIADRPMPGNLNVRGFSHLLGECGLTFFGSPQLLDTLPGTFPALLDQAPFLLPGEDAAIRPRLLRWFDEQDIRPRIVGEFDDSALMNSFGQTGTGLFVAPTATAAYLCKQYRVRAIGHAPAVKEQFYAITTDQRLEHPAVVALSRAAREDIFGAAK